MGIFIRRAKNAKGYAPYWQMKFITLEGKEKHMQTPIPVRGTPPASLSLLEEGNVAYEKSKTEAQAYFAKLMAEKKQKGSAQELTKILIEEKTGRKVDYVCIRDLYERWRGFSRSRSVTEARMKCSKHVFEEFAAFLQREKDWFNWKYLYEVTPDAAKAFIENVEQHLATSTAKDYLSLLSGTFRRLLPEGAANPFRDVKVQAGTADSQKIHREVLTRPQLNQLYETAQRAAEPYLYPITVCAANTGLRIGDVCRLKWQDVYLSDNHISTMTSKTNKVVHIPIFEDLRKVLESRLAEKEPDDIFVFPDAARQYTSNKSAIIQKGKRLFAEALFGDRCQEDITDVVDGEPVSPPSVEDVLAAIDGSNQFMDKAKPNYKEVYRRFRIGESYRTIAAAMNVSKGQVSTYLKGIERLLGNTVRPGICKTNTEFRLSLTRRRHQKCRNASSIYGWHSLRATFCTEAVFRHVPEALIIAVVGHSTFQTTMNYINPSWKAFEDAWTHNGGFYGNPTAVLPAPQKLPPAQALDLLQSTLTPEQLNALKSLGIAIRQQGLLSD